MYTKNRISVPFLIVIALTAVVAAMRNVSPASSASPQLLVVPSSIVDQSLGPGSTFTVNASVTDIVNLVTWQVKIFFDPTILNCTNAWYPADHIFAGQPTQPVTPLIDDTVGYVTFGNLLLSGSFTGSGTLCQINFTVLSRGNCALEFSTPYGGGTFLWDPDDSLISVTVTDGNFDNRQAVPTMYTLTITSTAGGTTSPSPGSYQYNQGTIAQVTATPDGTHVFANWTLDGSNAGSTNTKSVTMDSNHTLSATFTPVIVPPPGGTRIYVDPPEIIDPTLGPSSSFSINITLDQASNLHSCQFNMTYDSNIISWMGIQLFKIQNESASPEAISDDQGGYLWMRLTYRNPVAALTPTALVRIVFHVNAYGATYLNLTDTQLTDFAGQPISHTATSGFFATLTQDLAITNVTPSSTQAFPGALLDINVTAKNLGNMKESFDVNATYGSVLIGTQHVTDLASGADITLIFSWNTSSVAPGSYTIGGGCTVLPFEQNTANNVYYDGNVTISSGDLAVTNVVASRTVVYQGWLVNINVTAKNLGNMKESFDVNATYGSVLIGTQHVTDLASGADITLIFSWNTSSVATCHSYTIGGGCTVLPFEQNTANNVYYDGNVTVRLMGDVTGDGLVDMGDLRAVIKAFASYPGNPRWNPIMDLDQNGYVDMKDVRLAAKNFGKVCTP